MDISDLPPILGNSNIVVVTGWRDVGKTTYCQRAIDVYRAEGLIVSGLLSPARFDQKRHKTGFFALDLHSRETRLVASAIPGEIKGIHLGLWSFDTQVFAWGNHCLQQIERADVLVIDELGPLEFNLQTGWTASFEVLHNQKYRLALVVIRPECIESFSKLGFVFQTTEITASQMA